VALDGQRRRSSATGIIAAVLGLALLAWFIRQVGPDEIWQRLRQVGWGFIPIVVLGGLRFALRATAWKVCLEPPHRIPFGAAFSAVLAGDALGNLTPLGLIASEPTKAAFVRGRAPLGPAVTALAIENILYTLSVAAMIAASTMALLHSFDLPTAIRTASWVALASIAGGFMAVAWLVWQRPAVVSRLLSRIVPQTSRLQERIAQLGALEGQIYTFAMRRPGALMRALVAETSFHALGVVEVYVSWWLLQGEPPTLLIAFILEGAQRLAVVLFKFIPLQPGVAEWTTGSFTQLLGYGVTVGGTLSIVRKIRTVFWVLIGTALLVRRGVQR
jgi:hypothetical protein